MQRYPWRLQLERLNTQLIPKLFASMMFSSPEDRLNIAAPQNQILGVGGGGMGGGGGLGFGSGLNQHGVPIVGAGGGGWTRNTGGQGARVDSDGMDSSIFRSRYTLQGVMVKSQRQTIRLFISGRSTRRTAPAPANIAVAPAVI